MDGRSGSNQYAPTISGELKSIQTVQAFWINIYIKSQPNKAISEEIITQVCFSIFSCIMVSMTTHKNEQLAIHIWLIQAFQG